MSEEQTPSGIQVVGEREKHHDDLRWGTQNTKLAAALLVLGFKLASPEPFTAHLSGRQVSTVTIWFFPYITTDGVGAALPKPLLSHTVEVKWIEGEGGDMPELYWMRRALEARDYLIKEVVTGGKLPISGTRVKPRDMLITDSIREAAVALSCNARLHGFGDKRFYFQKQAELVIANSKHPEYKGRAKWALLAILQQQLLMDIIRGRSDEATKARVKGNFGTAWIPKLMPDNLKQAYLQYIDIGK